MFSFRIQHAKTHFLYLHGEHICLVSLHMHPALQYISQRKAVCSCLLCRHNVVYCVKIQILILLTPISGCNPYSKCVLPQCCVSIALHLFSDLLIKSWSANDWTGERIGQDFQPGDDGYRTERKWITHGENPGDTMRKQLYAEKAIQCKYLGILAGR